MFNFNLKSEMPDARYHINNKNSVILITHHLQLELSPESKDTNSRINYCTLISLIYQNIKLLQAGRNV